jgi:UDP-N-acetylmuramate dehydrogenase
VKLTLRELIERCKISQGFHFDYELKEFTGFKTGGPADLLFEPRSIKDLTCVYKLAKEHDIPCFILGDGANILVADKGIRGLVIRMHHLDRVEMLPGNLVKIEAGAELQDVAMDLGKQGYSGLDFLYGMPGSTGGSLFMNARCYGREIADVLESVEYLDPSGILHTYHARSEDFAYKKTPFQDDPDMLIVSGTFRLERTDAETIVASMEEKKQDRKSKGHFIAPCAGSVFKNNRKFGAPSGKLIDDIGLRGTQIGGAKISDHHANIIINTGNASSKDILQLIKYTARMVMIDYGYVLEPEVRPVGDWEEEVEKE